MFSDYSRAFQKRDVTSAKVGLQRTHYFPSIEVPSER